MLLKIPSGRLFFIFYFKRALLSYWFSIDSSKQFILYPLMDWDYYGETLTCREIKITQSAKSQTHRSPYFTINIPPNFLQWHNRISSNWACGHTDYQIQVGHVHFHSAVSVFCNKDNKLGKYNVLLKGGGGGAGKEAKISNVHLQKQ